MMKSKKLIRYIVVILCAVILVSAIGIAMACRNTDIPKLYFEGNIDWMFEKTDVRSITFKYDDGKNVTKGYATLKVQGTSSLGYDKKNYTINLYADAEHEEKLKIDLGWGAQNKYCLKANWKKWRSCGIMAAFLKEERWNRCKRDCLRLRRRFAWLPLALLMRR